MNSNTKLAATQLEQLDELSDFEKLLSPSGQISICGFGSLVSERSARSTFPSLLNFRVAKLKGFRRVFAHVAPIFFDRGIPSQKLRELEFRFLAVLPETLDGEPFANPAVLCGRYSDEEFFQIRCKGSKDIYFQQYGRCNIEKIWQDDILQCHVYLRHCLIFSVCISCRAVPCSAYLQHCVLAAKNLGDIAYNNFLDHTFLGDRTTTMRTYSTTTGSGIMEEQPPESLKSRYGG
ncbi:putative protein phosphatase 2C 73-like [Hibiscus syriacus]|uniref:Uncharacterized protein n=1 Tax=Hibiscus syriacus TaxID=106335 RepID=A0A6A2YPC3_HIBSY|nr:putative protein phosphatase 2C 73-like [Hibiscus syriacus]